MMQSDFKESFSVVASSFGAKPDEGRALAYFKFFQHLNDKQWQTLCEWSVQLCDRFPTVKDMTRGMYEMNMVQRPKLSELDKDQFVVVCTCGSSFAFSRNDIAATYHCPGPECHVSYDYAFIMREADQYNVLWADAGIRQTLKSKISKDGAMKAVYELLGTMHVDLEPERKTLKEIRALQPKTPAPETMFTKSFDGTDPRPSPFV